MWGASEDQEEDDRHLPPLPGHKLHRCTDVFCLLLFLALVGHGVYAGSYAIKNGNLRRLTHGQNYKGENCGSNGQGNFLFWCKNSSTTLNLAHPICVKKCPESNLTTSDCVTDAMTQITTQTRDYPTRVFFFSYCLPDDEELMTYVVGEFLGEGWHEQLIRPISQILKASGVMFIAGGIAILMGLFYLVLLRFCASCLVRTSLAGLVLGPIGIGVYFIFVSKHGGSDGIEGTEDGHGDLYTGVGAIIAGVLLGLLAWCNSNGLSTAVGCIEASCECIFQNPSMLVEPFISLSFKIGVLVPVSWAFMLMLSCNDGDWTLKEQLYIVELGFLMLWLLELTHAMSQYSLAFATQIWYFTPYVNGAKEDLPKFGIIQGYCNALIFHLGSLALSSFLFAIFRPIHTVLRVISSLAEDTGNPVTAVTSRACFVCTSCYKNTLGFLDKTAYMDMAISSSGFCSASERALEIVYDEVPAVAALNGAQFIFQLAGIGAISVGSGMSTLFITRNLAMFADPQKSTFIPDPKPVCFAAGVVGGLLALSFMAVFDTVGDTILYCFAVDQRRINHLQSKAEKSSEGVGLFGWFFGGGEDEDVGGDLSVNYAPPRLRELIDSEHASLVAKNAEMEMS